LVSAIGKLCLLKPQRDERIDERRAPGARRQPVEPHRGDHGAERERVALRDAPDLIRDEADG
jgi:hypothetical protein